LVVTIEALTPNSYGARALPFADALDLGGVEGIELPAALALLLGADLARPRKRLRERRFQRRLAADLAADVADQPAEPRAQKAQLAAMALELLGVGVAPRHHRRPLGDALVRLAQSNAVRAGEPPEPDDRRMQELGVGREGDRLRLDGGVHSDALEVLRAQRARVMRHAQALGQKQFELVAEPLAPVAQVRALMREGVLEKLLAGEVLEIRVVDPALADLFVGQREHVLEQQKPDHEPRLDSRPPRLGIERGDLCIEPVPVDPLGKPRSASPASRRLPCRLQLRQTPQNSQRINPARIRLQKMDGRPLSPQIQPDPSQSGLYT
jgi:hypothetical protein